MQLIKAGRRVLNLNYLIMAEEGEAGAPVPPGCVRVTMSAGKEFDLTGDEAEEFRREASRVLQGQRGRSGSGHATKAVRVNPGAPGISPGPAGKRKQGG